MSRRPDRAGRAALAGYRDTPRAARLHVAVRWVTCPFRPVADALPGTGRVLEIGCGHGLFSAYLAHLRPDLLVRGVDIDAEKVEVAVAGGTPRDRVSFAVGRSGEVPAGPWDGVVLVDVLYLLPASEQRTLLEQCAAVLAPGGVLAVKDMAVTPRWKAAWNRLQETVSVRLLRITAGSPQFAFVDQAERAGWLTAAGLHAVTSRRLDRRRVHPHHLVVGRAPW